MVHVFWIQVNADAADKNTVTHTHTLSHTHAHWHRYDGMTTYCMCSIQKQIDSDRVWYRVHLLCTVCRYAYVGINEGLYLIISYDIFCCSLPAGSACRNEAAFCPPLAPISCRLMKAKRARNARNEHNSAYIQHNEPMQANVCHRLDMFLDTQRSHHVVM